MAKCTYERSGKQWIIHSTLTRKQNSDSHYCSFQAPRHHCSTLLHRLHIVRHKPQPSLFLRCLQEYIWFCHLPAHTKCVIAHLPPTKLIQHNAPDTNGIKTQDHRCFDTPSCQLASIGWSCWDLSFDPVQVNLSTLNSGFNLGEDYLD